MPVIVKYVIPVGTLTVMVVEELPVVMLTLGGTKAVGLLESSTVTS